MTVGQKIKTRREELKMSQEELAQKCGYKSRSSINKIEMSRDLPLKKVNMKKLPRVAPSIFNKSYLHVKPARHGYSFR